MKPTEEQKSTAMLHATAWGRAWDDCRKQAETMKALGRDASAMEALTALAMNVTSGYREIANGKEIEE